MIKRLLLHSSIYSVSTVLSRGISFLLLPLYTRVLTPAEFGALDLIYLLGLIIGYVASFEIMQGVARYYAESTDHEKKDILSTALWFNLMAYTIVLIIFISQGHYFCILIFDDLSWLNTYYLAIVSIYFNGFFLFFQNSFRYQLRAKLSGVISIIYTAVTAVVAVTVIYTLDYSINAIYLGYITGSLVCIALSIGIDRRSFTITFEFSILKKLLSFSVPLIPSSLAVFVSFYIDRIIIKEQLGLQELGIYSIAIRFASIINLAISGLRLALTPLIYAEYKQNDIRGNLSLLSTIFFCIGLSAVAFFTVFSDWILIIFTQKEYYGAAPYIAFVTLNVITSSAYLFYPGLSLEKKTVSISLINIGSGVLNLILNLILIRKFGILGAVTATFISLLLNFLVQLKLGQKYFYVPIRYSRISIFFLSALLLVSLPIMVDNQKVFISPYVKHTIAIVIYIAGIYAIAGAKTIGKLARYNWRDKLFNV